MTWIDDRGALLSKAILQKIDKVYSGPFKGTKFNFDQHEGNFAPYLLGTYEHELEEVINRIIWPYSSDHKKYKNVFNVGCSFGYYAVGLARWLDRAQVCILDILPSVEQACIANAELNGAKVTKVSFQEGMIFADLLIMDVEGHEAQYLDPAKYQFNKTDILVESHECMTLGITQEIINRFKYTHDIKIINNEPSYFDLRRIFGLEFELEHFDNAIVTFEGRAGATPWIWMTCKK